MTDELKPVRCGCGGEAKTVLNEFYDYSTHCLVCGMSTRAFDTEAEAITAWNLAMSGVAVAKNATTERTAKVEDKYHDYLPYSRFMESKLKGDCGFCGETVWLGEKYCHECGAKLDWSGNE